MSSSLKRASPGRFDLLMQGPTPLESYDQLSVWQRSPYFSPSAVDYNTIFRLAHAQPQLAVRLTAVCQACQRDDEFFASLTEGDQWRARIALSDWLVLAETMTVLAKSACLQRCAAPVVAGLASASCGTASNPRFPQEFCAWLRCLEYAGRPPTPKRTNGVIDADAGAPAAPDAKRARFNVDGEEVE